MKIKMKTLLAGPELSAQPGEVIDVNPEMGNALVEGGFAENLDIVDTLIVATGLKPGDVDPDAVAKAKAIANELVTVEGVDLSKKNAEEMIAFITEQKDIELLTGIAEKDNRVTVQKAAAKRIEVLKAQ